MGARVRLDLSEFFGCVRQQSFLFLDYSRDKTVGDVEEHIRQVFNISDPVALQIDGCHLPASEDSHLLRDGDAVNVINAKPSKKKKKRKRVEPNDSLCNSSDKERCHTEEDNLSKVGFKPVNKKRKSEVDGNEEDTSEICQVDCREGEGITVKECDSNENCEENGSTSSFMESNNGSHQPPDNTDENETVISDLSQSDSRRKRIRRRKKKKLAENGTKVIEEPCKESLFLKSKQLFGVGHILPTKEKQHIFFSDDEVPDSSQSRPASSPKAAIAQKTIEPKTVDESIGDKSVSSAGSAAELTELLALKQRRKPIVFERKKPDNLIITVKSSGQRNVLPEQIVKGAVLTEIPNKDSAICFKILKMVNYSPQMSEELIGLVSSVDVTSGQLEIKILYGFKEFHQEKGKFSLDEEDSNENHEYVSLNWNELLEPQSCQISGITD